MSAIQIKKLRALQQKKSKLLSDERAANVLLQEKLQKAIDFLPATVLMQYNMMDACKDRAKKAMVKTISRMLQSFLKKGFVQWVHVVKAMIEKDRQMAAFVLARVCLGFLARMRVRRMKHQLSDAEFAVELKRRQRALLEARHITIIQCAVRGWLARIKFRRLLKHIAASNFIKTFYRVRKTLGRCREIYRLNALKLESAMLIQRAWRGFRGRMKACLVRAAKHRALVQERYADRDELFQYYFEQVGAALVLQRWFRGWSWRLKLKWNEKYQKLLEKKKYLEQFKKPAVMNRNAIHLTRVVRGFLGRQIVRRIQVEAAAMKMIENRESACAAIQSIVRGNIARSRFPSFGMRMRSIVLRKRRWLKVLAMEAKANEQKAYFPRRRDSISFHNLVIGDGKRIALMSNAAVIIQCAYRKFIAKKVYITLIADHKEKMAIVIQNWIRRKLRSNYLLAIEMQYQLYLRFKQLQHNSAKRIQKLARRRAKNKLMLRIIHLRWIGIRRLQRWTHRRLAARRRKASLRYLREHAESNASGDHLYLKTVFYATVEFLWFGMKKTKNLEVQHEMQAYFLAISGQARMLDSVKAIKLSKGYSGLLDDVVTPNVIELQFSKVKALTEKKLDYPRYISLLANLAAIKFIGLNPSTVNGLMHDTPFSSVIPGLNVKSKKVGDQGDGGEKAGGSKAPLSRNAPKPESIQESEAGNANRAAIDSYSLCRLRGKAALVVKFLLTYLVKNKECAPIFQGLQDKSAWSVARNFVTSKIIRIQLFARGRVARLRYLKSVQLRSMAVELNRRNRAATKIQCLGRKYLARYRVLPIAQMVYCKYTDEESKMPYWFNPRTEKAFWVKPKLLLHLDCGFPVTIPGPDEQFVEKCVYCDEKTATLYCNECVDGYCSNCFGKFHKASHRRNHTTMPILNCIECDFQAGVRYCTACKDVFCDSCYAVMHSKGRNRLHVCKWNHEICMDCGQRAAQWKKIDLETGRSLDYCVVCYKDTFQVAPPAAEKSVRLKFVGMKVVEHRAEVEKHRKLEEKQAAHERHALFAKERRRQSACALIQRVWRGRHAYKLIKDFLGERKEFLRLREEEMPTRLSVWYKIREILGIPIHLKSDTTLEKVHKLYPFYMQGILRACVESDWSLACRLLDEHEDALRVGREKGTVMQGSPYALNNLIHRALVSMEVNKLDLEMVALDGRIMYMKNTLVDLNMKLEEARAIPDTPKSVKDKLVNDIKSAEKHLGIAIRDKALVEKNFKEARQRQHDFMGPRGLQRLVRDRRKHGVRLPFKVSMRKGSRVALTKWDKIISDDDSVSSGLSKRGAVSTKALRENGWLDEKLESKTDDNEDGQPIAQGLWKAKLKIGDVLLLNGVTFTVVRKESVFRHSAVRPPSPVKEVLIQEEIEETKEDNDENEDDDGDDEAALKRKKSKKDSDEMADLAKLTLDQSVEVVDPWAAEPPFFPEISEAEFTNDHIALDRPWVLENADEVEVFKLVPAVFYAQPIISIAKTLSRTYPVQKAVAIAAIACGTFASFSRNRAAKFDDDSDSAANLKARAVSLDIYRDNWLKHSRSVVHMTFDFALRRSTYRTLKLFGRGFAILGRVGVKLIAKKTKKKELSPFQHWETSKGKVVMNVYSAAPTEDDDDFLIGTIKVDPKAPADILREYIRRTFQTELNEGPFGDSFLFSKEKKGSKPEIFPRSVEPRKFAKDMTVLRMDHQTMETTLCVVIVPEPNVAKVLVEIAPDIDPDDESAVVPATIVTNSDADTKSTKSKKSKVKSKQAK